MRHLRSLLLLAFATSTLAQQPTSQDPATPTQAGTRLVYDLPAYDVGRLVDVGKGATIDSVVADFLGKLQQRLGLRAEVTSLGGTVFAVDVQGDAGSAAAVRPFVEAGSVEMRVVATSDYRSDGVTFDLPQERKRLEQWLAAGGRQLVLTDPRQIARFNHDPVHGPLAAGHLRWVPHFVEPQVEDATKWTMPLSSGRGGETPPLSDSTVAVFDAGADFNGGVVPVHHRASPLLLEFVAINWHERFFSGADLDPGGVVADVDGSGWPALRYKVRDSRAALYADWSGKYIRKHIAMLVDGRVRSAPYFASRIAGIGMISGRFTEAEVAALVEMLRRGALPLAPILLRQEPLRARR